MKYLTKFNSLEIFGIFLQFCKSQTFYRGMYNCIVNILTCKPHVLWEARTSYLAWIYCVYLISHSWKSDEEESAVKGNKNSFVYQSGDNEMNSSYIPEDLIKDGKCHIVQRVIRAN